MYILFKLNRDKSGFFLYKWCEDREIENRDLDLCRSDWMQQLLKVHVLPEYHNVRTILRVSANRWTWLLVRYTSFYVSPCGGLWLHIRHKVPGAVCCSISDTRCLGQSVAPFQTQGAWSSLWLHIRHKVPGAVCDFISDTRCLGQSVHMHTSSFFSQVKNSHVRRLHRSALPSCSPFPFLWSQA